MHHTEIAVGMCVHNLRRVNGRVLGFEKRKYSFSNFHYIAKVVYDCPDWNEYSKFPGTETNVDDLYPGWFDEINGRVIPNTELVMEKLNGNDQWFKLRGAIEMLVTEKNGNIRRDYANRIESLKTAFDGRELTSLTIKVDLRNQKDCEELIDLLRTHLHCFPRDMKKPFSAYGIDPYDSGSNLQPRYWKSVPKIFHQQKVPSQLTATEIAKQIEEEVKKMDEIEARHLEQLKSKNSRTKTICSNSSRRKISKRSQGACKTFWPQRLRYSLTK